MFIILKWERYTPSYRKEMMPKINKTQWLKILLLLAAMVSLAIGSFFAMAWIMGVPFNKNVEPVYANGLITASGVFLGFVFAATISRREELEFADVFITALPIAVFFCAMIIVFESAITNGLKVSDLAILQGNLYFDFAWSLFFLEKMVSERKARSKGSNHSA